MVDSCLSVVGSDWEVCPPTEVLEMKQNSGPGDYVHILHSGKGRDLGQSGESWLK